MPVRQLTIHALGMPKGEAVGEMDRVDIAMIGNGVVAVAALCFAKTISPEVDPIAATLNTGPMSMLMSVGRSPLTWSTVAAALICTVAASWVCYRMTRGKRDCLLWKAALKGLAGIAYAVTCGAGMAFLCFAILVPEQRLAFAIIGPVYLFLAYALTYTVGRALDQRSLW